MRVEVGPIIRDEACHVCHDTGTANVLPYRYDSGDLYVIDVPCSACIECRDCGGYGSVFRGDEEDTCPTCDGHGRVPT